MSYVLIVEQPENQEEKDEKDDELKVFDFDDNEDPNAVVSHLSTKTKTHYIFDSKPRCYKL